MELEVSGVPRPYLGQGHGEYLAGDIVDQVVVLGEADELVWADQAMIGVLPAHQGLNPHDVTT